jgi:hypothetical protein
MGSIPGQELGLGSGIVNMSRQVGFGLGVAILVAVLTGTFEDNVARARKEAGAVAHAAGYDGARRDAVLRRAFADPTRTGARPQAPHDPVGRAASRLAAEASRDSFGSGFRVAALAVLLALPFALTMRRRPADARAAAGARAS